MIAVFPGRSVVFHMTANESLCLLDDPRELRQIRKVLLDTWSFRQETLKYNFKRRHSRDDYRVYPKYLDALTSYH